MRVCPRRSNPGMGRCQNVRSSMGASERDELAQAIAVLQPAEVADLVVETYKTAQNRGILIGVGVGVIGCIVVRKLLGR